MDFVTEAIGSGQRLVAISERYREIPDLIITVRSLQWDISDITNLLRVNVCMLEDWRFFAFFWERYRVPISFNCLHLRELLQTLNSVDVSWECSMRKWNNRLVLYLPAAGYIEKEWPNACIARVVDAFQAAARRVEGGV